jgi:hypothetical protein
VLTNGGDGRRWLDFGEGRPAVELVGGSGLHGGRCSGGQLVSGAGVLSRLGIADLLVVTDCSGSASGRRIERREATTADGLALQAMAALRRPACDGEMFVGRGTASRSS